MTKQHYCINIQEFEILKSSKHMQLNNGKTYCNKPSTVLFE